MSEEKNEFATEAEEIASMNGGAEAPIDAGVDDIDALKAQIVALTSDLQRERAEFSNFRKRAVAEKTQHAAMTTSRILTDLLPALDALDQFFAVYAAKAETDTALKPIVDGVTLVNKQITRVFTESGVEEFSPAGEEFNPAHMEALSMLEGDVERDTVTQVFQKGYRIEGRLIRPARVVVTKPKGKTEGENNG